MSAVDSTRLQQNTMVSNWLKKFCLLHLFRLVGVVPGSRALAAGPGPDGGVAGGAPLALPAGVLQQDHVGVSVSAQWATQG